MNRLWKCSLSFLIIVVIATAALAAPANRHILIIADTQHGLGLVPEGTPIPRGLSLFVDEEKVPASFVRREGLGDDATPRAGADRLGQRLMLVHAPESAFEKARAAEGRVSKLRPPFKAVPNDFYFSVSVYFADQDFTVEQDLDFVSYAYSGAKIYLYTGSNDMSTGSLTGSQSSNLSPDAFSDGCYTTFSMANSATCATSYVYASAVQATVTTYGRIQGRTYDGCGYAGATPCSVFHAATIHTTYIWISSSDYSTDYYTE